MGLDAQMKALGRGDMSRFDEVYDATNRAVYFVALSVLGDRMLAEDVMQNTFLSVIEHAGQFSGTGAKAWIAAIARNAALSMRSRRQRETAVDANENPALFGTETTDDYGLLIDLARRILPADEFQILMLVNEGYKRREAAEVMKMPVGTVTWKYKRALSALKEALQERERSKST